MQVRDHANPKWHTFVCSVGNRAAAGPKHLNRRDRAPAGPCCCRSCLANRTPAGCESRPTPGCAIRPRPVSETDSQGLVSRGPFLQGPFLEDWGTFQLHGNSKFKLGEKYFLVLSILVSVFFGRYLYLAVLSDSSSSSFFFGIV